MDVILLERVEGLGQMGDVVKVRDGYARNFLVPQKKALLATKDNRQRFERERAALEKLNAERRAEAEKQAGAIHGSTWVVIRQASDTQQLYGSVTARDVARVLSEAGTPVSRQQVQLESTIKELGIYPVKIKLHPEITSEIRINVARTPEEAELQARTPGGRLAPTPGVARAEVEAAESPSAPSKGMAEGAAG
jgi:large subunit ribosomal protein L9